jgi:hypothetical protein
MIKCDAEGEAWFRDRLATVNAVLADNQLPPHREPERLPGPAPRGMGGFPYSFLHYLRRAYACVIEGAPLRTGPLTEDDETFIFDVAVTLMDSHLLSHSDCEGYYAPADFDLPLCDDRLPGGFLGSSRRLLAELEQVAPALGIGLPLSAGARAALEQVGEDDPLYREKMVWYTLYEATRASVAQETLVVFS